MSLIVLLWIDLILCDTLFQFLFFFLTVNLTLTYCSHPPPLSAPGPSTWSLRKKWRWRESLLTASRRRAPSWPAKKRTQTTRVSASPRRSAWERAFSKSVPVAKVNVSFVHFLTHNQYSTVSVTWLPSLFSAVLADIMMISVTTSTFLPMRHLHKSLGFNTQQRAKISDFCRPALSAFMTHVILTSVKHPYCFHSCYHQHW